jgi:glycine/D-amino acid oxidase-like deaminating enzyme
VVVLEAGAHVAAEASGRNGGHVNNGLAVDYAEVAAKVGVERARAWYHAYDDAVDTVARLVEQEQIACDFLRHGKLKMATKPCSDGCPATQRRPPHRRRRGQRRGDPDAARVRAEVQSERFHGGLLYKRSGQMHMGRFAYGLATAAERHGAAIHTGTEVRRLERIGNTHAHRVHTARGTIWPSRSCWPPVPAATVPMAASAGCAGASCPSAASSW